MTDTHDEQAPSWAHIGFMAVLGGVGWTLLASPGLVPGLVPAVQPALSSTAIAVFVAIVVIARSMAFSPLPGTVISIDSGFYVAAALCFGSIASGWIVALALTLDAMIRLVTGPKRRRKRSWLDAIVYVTYFGGMSGALLAVVSRVFGADATALHHGGDKLRVLGSVVVIGASFVILHYAIQGVRIRLAGRRAGSFLTRMGLPGIVAELSLLPLAAVVVFVYQPESLLGLLLLGGTYLLIALGFNRLSRAGSKLRRRVKELETLGATSQRLSASLHLHELIEAVAESTISAIENAHAMSLSRRDGDSFFVDTYFARSEEFRRSRCAIDGLAASVLEQDETVHWTVGQGEGKGALENARSWLGAPVRVYGEVEAVLSIESRIAAAFTADDQRLLEGIASQTSVALQNAQHYELAMVDGLTGLFVRRYFDARLDEEIERSKRFETKFAVAMVDIDDFKKLNDTYGHAAGDVTLGEVARALRGEMRGIDTAARYGGEEFALVLPRTSLTEAYALAERIRTRIAELEVDAPGLERPLKVSASFGIAAYPESGAESAEDLLRLADKSLYRAKRTGKNRVELYWPDDEGQGASLRPVTAKP